MKPEESSSKPNIRLDDRSTLRDRFRFELDDDSWLRQLREYTQTTPPGRVGSYELLETIGRGGQGLVFKARQPRTGRIVAIKRLTAGVFATPEMQDRFRREIEAAATLEHPGIVTIFGSEIVDGQAVLAMQWIDGQPIHLWAQPVGGAPHSLQEILEVFVALCDAVQHAHMRGVIHRDLKPTNILVDANGRPHVLDFGLAKFESNHSLAETITISGAFLGTPAYAAPEQVCGNNRLIDTRTDVYALGAVLYQLLVNQTLFGDEAGLSRLIQNILHVQPRTPSSLNPGLNRELDAIVLKALAKEKHMRYQSVEALSSDIQRFLNGQAVLAHPPSRLYRLRKFIRQHRGGVVVWVGFVLLLMIATATSTFYYFKAKEQAANAHREAVAQRTLNSFLDATFSRANANSRSETSEITVREALNLAAAELSDEELTYPPDVEARLRKAIANALFGAGSIREAFPIAQKAVASSRQAVAQGLPPCFDCYSLLARAQSTLGDYRQALATAKEALEIFDTRKDLIAEHRPQVLRWLALMEFLMGDLKSAELSARQALEECTNEDPLVVAPARLLLSRMLPNNHPDYKAETLAREVLSFNRQRGADGREAAVPLARIAAMVRERGEFKEAHELISEAITLQREARGVFHHDELWMQIELALIFKDFGDLEQTESVLRQVVQLGSERLGEESKVTIDARVGLGMVLHAKEDDAAALILLEKALNMCRHKFGTENIYSARVEAALAPMLANLGRAEESEQLFRHALAIRREVLGERSETATNIHQLGAFLLDQGRRDEARPILEEALAMRRKVRGPDHRETKETERLITTSP